MKRVSTLRRIAPISLLAVTATMIAAGNGSADLSSQYAAGQQRASQLQSAIQADSTRIQGYQGTIGSLQTRLNVIQQSVLVQQRLLRSVQQALTASRIRLAQLQVSYARDKQVLADELRAEYESPPPSVVNVVVDAGGFQDLINQLSDLKAIEDQNATVIRQVNLARAAVTVQANRLAAIAIRRRRATAAVLVERDQVANLRLSIVGRELVYERARDRQTTQLTTLQRTLSHQAAILAQRAVAAQVDSSGGVAPPPPGGCIDTPFVAHGGEFGLFLAPGTNYTVNEEPVIAARLDALGKALQLHLIGISGYRTPQHSVEVGGFADDPHTRGEASDTPGIEGVPEATLEEYCLTRPFPGPREADHIQEL
jgi:hypothetical protein